MEGLMPLTIAGISNGGGRLCIWDDGCKELGEGREAAQISSSLYGVRPSAVFA